MERDVFLARVAAARTEASLPAAPAESPGGFAPELASTHLISLFTERLEAVAGRVHRAVANHAPGLVTRIAKRHGASSVLSWDEPELPTPGVLRRLLADGLTWVDAQVPRDAAGRLAHQQAYDDVVLGLTGADAGLAESGSVVLTSGHGRSRMASVVPFVHVVLLPVERIVRSLSHYLAMHPTADADHTNLIVITGPSRTADIEFKLTIGVHGPKHVEVVLIE
jgi:L-lactate dehydrogenase complex protein LldG